MISENMRVLVHFHVHYHDQVEWFVSRLANIGGCEWDLFVTFSSMPPETEAMLKALKPDVHLVRTDNVGYDVWPFISLVKSVRLEDYDLVLKLHTKSRSPIRVHRLKYEGYEWRNALVDSILKSPGQFGRALRAFRDDKVGLVCSDAFRMETLGWCEEEAGLLDGELKRLGLAVSDRHFCVGTMFLVRASVLEFLRRAEITEDMFPVKMASNSKGTMAHVYERILSMAPGAYGYKTVCLSSDPLRSLYLNADRLFTGLFRNLFSVNREGPDREKILRLMGLKIRIPSRERVAASAKIVLFAHILNPLFLSREARSRRRGEVISRAVDKYLDSYVPVIRSVSAAGPLPSDSVCGSCCRQDEPERIFSIWLQGEESAPEIVKACLASMRRNCTQEVVVLDERTVWDWISLPQTIIRKWREGKIRPAHFSDICRVALLYRYGGIWFDATDFVARPVHERVMNEDFFIYMSGDSVNGRYSYIQNCFFRAKKGNYILKAWLETMLEYWRREDSPVNYFIHQMIFRKVVESSPLAGELFARMPHVNQDATHELWWGHRDEPFDQAVFDRITSSAVFQKTEYKSASSRKPIPGSFADVMIRMYRQ